MITALQVAACSFAVLCFFIAWTQANTVYTETLRILPNVGVVLTAKAPSGFTTTHFLDWQHVGPVIINEVCGTFSSSGGWEMPHGQPSVIILF